MNTSAVYERELRAYQILRQHHIDEIKGFQIPRLARCDPELIAIEMTVVDAPFLLDFASAYTEEEYQRFQFSQEVLNERELYWSEIFDEHWPLIKSVCEEFQKVTGLVLLDLSLNNIRVV